MTSPAPDYLRPYVSAAERHGGGFGSLLWASPTTQSARFDALARLTRFQHRSVLDVGCGRADLLDFLVDRGTPPEHYTGIEAVDVLAAAAAAKWRPASIIVRADFVAEPARLFTAADVVVFCGSLNTLEDDRFYATIRTAFDAAVEELAFNFLCSPRLAGTNFLHWHPPEEVITFARGLGGVVEGLADYLDGDCTLCVRKDECPR